MRLPDGPVLVSGGAGFIGSHLVRRLVSLSADVHLIVRAGTRTHRVADTIDRVRVWTADLRDEEEIEKVCRAVQPRWVFHLAGSTKTRFLDPKLESVRESIDVNILGCINLVAALSRISSVIRMIRTGSLEEYGNGPVPYVETQRERPVSPYSASQVAVTQYLQMLQSVLPFEVITLRAALTYGPMQDESFLIPSLIRHCLEARSFNLTSGTQERDFVFVSDVVEALLAAAGTGGIGGQIINVGSGRSVSVSDVARKIVQQCGADIEIRTGAAPPRSSEISRLVCNPARAARLLGWHAETSLTAGLACTIRWAKANPVTTAGSQVRVG